MPVFLAIKVKAFTVVGMGEGGPPYYADLSYTAGRARVVRASQ